MTNTENQTTEYQSKENYYFEYNTENKYDSYITNDNKKVMTIKILENVFQLREDLSLGRLVDFFTSLNDQPDKPNNYMDILSGLVSLMKLKYNTEGELLKVNKSEYVLLEGRFMMHLCHFIQDLYFKGFSFTEEFKHIIHRSIKFQRNFDTMGLELSIDLDARDAKEANKLNQ